ncbi:hypothetical protein FPV67DRAFT_1747375 [Lyophyllum atratum]|nr:hypothetical protein FPV67DRAFT_1747375 [Lyophyllum atratum]
MAVRIQFLIWHSAPDVRNGPTSNVDLGILQDIRSLLKEQNDLIQRLDKRQAEAALSHLFQARSSSVWNPLLKSTLKNTESTLERWRGGLDTLLIFVGLFSAIVTAFLVESLKTLQPDQVARTNELLANLTDIIIALSTQPSAATLELKRPKLFVPTPSDRWAKAKVFLGPCLEALPQVLLIPVALFIEGLLDTLFTASPGIKPIFAASFICLVLVTAVGTLLCGALIHGIRYSKVSPYQTSLSCYLNSRNTPKDPDAASNLGTLLPHIHDEIDLSPANRKVYHMALQDTFDDEVLDQASAALEGIMHDFKSSERPYDQTDFPDLGLRSILHLLSPEASLRSNLSAARMVRKLCLGFDATAEDKRFYATVI